MPITNSPNMSLPIPTVGTEPSPDYASDVNASLTIVDAHNHTPGSGVQITPAGLNINTSLSFNGNSAIGVGALTLTAQSAPPVNGSVYRGTTDLFFVDGIGNNIQITANGGIAGTSGSIANLTPPASAAYVSGSSTFVWQSNTGIAANMDFGAAILRNLSPNSTNGLTLQPPQPLTSNYTITLPTLPTSQKIMTLDASGNMTAPYVVDNTTITISSNIIGVPDGGITTSKLADGSVTKPKQAAVGQQISSSSGSFSTSSTSPVDVTNLTVTITTTGRPIMLMLIGDGGASTIQSNNGTGTAGPGWTLTMLRGVTTISSQQERLFLTTGTPNQYNRPSSAYNQLDTPAAGTYTYKVQIAASGGATITVANTKLAAYEL